MRFRLKGALSALLLAAGSTLSSQGADTFASGFLKYEYFGAIDNTPITNLTSNARYIANNPDSVLWMQNLDTRSVLPDDTHESYGARITGFLMPAETGDYDFFIRSDDASQLFLSTDATTNNLVLLAEEGREGQCCQAFLEPGAEETTAAPVHLIAGTKYALKVLLKEGGGGDYVQVAWRNVLNATPAANLKPISSPFLGVNVQTAGAISITSQPQSVTVLPGTPAVFSVAYNGAVFAPQVGVPVGNMLTNIVGIQWYRDGVPIVGAQTASYALPQAQATDNNAKFTAKVFVMGTSASVTSSEATLKVDAAATEQPNLGFLMYEYYGNIPNATIADLQGDANFLANTPDSVLWMTSFDSRGVLPLDDHETYGARITGFIVPTETADYDFFIKSDDASQLYLSTDENMANLAMVAEETGCCHAFTEPGTAATTTATPIHLEAGKRYGVQALLKEGGGGDFVQVAWRKTTDTTPAANLAPIPGSYLASYTGSGAAVTVTQQPANATVAENSPVTFTVAYTADTRAAARASIGNMVNPASVVWYKNGVVIPGAVGTNLTIALAKAADNNAKISAKIGVGGPSVTTTDATLTVTTDTTAPTLLGVNTDSTFTNITLTFSEPITAASATVLANYAADHGLAITSVTQVNPTTVRLGTGVQTLGTAYNITINNLKDTSAGAGNLILANTQATATAYILVTGAVRVDRYFNVTAALDTTAAPDSAIADPRFPNNPDDTIYWNIFGPLSAGNNYGDNYALRVTGWILPPKSGDYKFFIRSDDQSQLSLSTDDSPANLVTIASQASCCGGFVDAEGTLSSSPIALEAGKRYFVEGLLKEGGGDDYLQVAWNTPDSADLNSVTNLVPIAGQYLQTYLDPIASVQITLQPTNQTVTANTPASLTVGYIATNSNLGGFATVQWQRAPSGSSTFTNIPGATSATYTIPFVDPADNGAKYHAVVSVLSLATATSADATFTVLIDNVLPTVAGVTGSDKSVFVTFSEPLDIASAGTIANYTLDQGATVTAATIISTSGPGVVQLTISGGTLGKTYHISVTGVKDRAGNAMTPFNGSFGAFSAFYDFASAILPPGTILSGSATLTNGALQLTAPVVSLLGGILVPDPVNGQAVTNFLIRFKLFLGEGSGNAADGFSVSYGTDVPDAAAGGEEGNGTGIIFTFDVYDNGGGEAPAVGAKLFGAEITTTVVPKATLVNDRWVDVALRLNADNTIDIIHDGTTYVDHLAVDGFTPLEGGRFLFQARTGGEYEAARIDDITIVVNGDVSLPVTGNIGTLNAPTISGHNVTISWTGVGTLQSSATVDGPYTDVTGVSGTSIVVDVGTTASAKFYRLRN